MSSVYFSSARPIGIKKRTNAGSRSFRKVVRSAVTDAEAEVKGLQTRIAKARTSVTSLPAQIEDGDPAPACRAQLTNVEQRVLAGERRLVQMKDHVARLRELEGVAARLTSVKTSATPHVTRAASRSRQKSLKRFGASAV